MKFALLASGSSGNCFLLSDRNINIIIDCGTTQKYIKESLTSLDIALSDIDAVMITHAHIDHVRAINMFRGHAIYAPIELGTHSLQKIFPDIEFQLGHLTILPIKLSHDADGTVGYIINNGVEKLVYITDTGYVPRKYVPLTRNADYYIVESNHDEDMIQETLRPQHIIDRILSNKGHLSNKQSAAFLREVVGENTKDIVLAHISSEANDRDLCLETICSSLHKKLPTYADGINVSVSYPSDIVFGGVWSEETKNCTEFDTDLKKCNFKDLPNAFTRKTCQRCGGHVAPEDGVHCDECGSLYHSKCWNTLVGCCSYYCSVYKHLEPTDFVNPINDLDDWKKPKYIDGVRNTTYPMDEVSDYKESSEVTHTNVIRHSSVTNKKLITDDSFIRLTDSYNEKPDNSYDTQKRKKGITKKQIKREVSLPEPETIEVDYVSNEKNKTNSLREEMRTKVPVNKYIFALLAIFFGIFGVHKLYQKKYKVAGLYIVLSLIGLAPFMMLISMGEGIHALFIRKDENKMVWVY